MNMIKGVTKSGFNFTINPDAVNDMRVIDAIADFENGDVLAASTLAKLLLGKEQRRNLYKCIADDSGKVSPEKFAQEFVEIFNSFPKTEKK